MQWVYSILHLPTLFMFSNFCLSVLCIQCIIQRKACPTRKFLILGFLYSTAKVTIPIFSRFKYFCSKILILSWIWRLCLENVWISDDSSQILEKKSLRLIWMNLKICIYMNISKECSFKIFHSCLNLLHIPIIQVLTPTCHHELEFPLSWFLLEFKKIGKKFWILAWIKI